MVDGKCPDTGMAVEWIQEKNYFFKMSKYADQLRQWIEDNPTFIQPDSRRNEMLHYLKKTSVTSVFLDQNQDCLGELNCLSIPNT